MGRILVIDDEAASLAITQGVLEAAGHEVLTTTDPQQALPLGAEQSVEAVVLDIRMPGMTGFDVLKALRDTPELSQVPVLFLSGLDSGSDRVKGLRSGANDYLVKPYEPEELIARVDNILSQSPHGLRGDFSVVPLTEILHTLEHTRATGILHIAHSGEQRGQLVLESGSLVGSRFGGHRGTDAFFFLYFPQEGHFEFSPSKHVHPEKFLEDASAITAPYPLRELIQKAEQLRKELQQRAPTLPSEDAFLIAVKRNDANALCAQADQNLPLKKIYRFLQCSDEGHRFKELLWWEFASPVQVKLAVASLIQLGLLRASRTRLATNGAPPRSKRST